MTGGVTVLRIGSGMAELTRGLDELGRILDGHGVAARPRFQVELVFEELVTNVIRYGYDDDAVHAVDVAVDIDPDSIVLVVSDDGRPFNPLEKSDPLPQQSLGEATIGGLGIMLVRKAARDVSYARVDGRNTLTVVIAAE